MRAKLRQLRQELHRRMHDPIAQTGRWPQSVVQATSTTTRWETSTASRSSENDCCTVVAQIASPKPKGSVLMESYVGC